MRTLAALALLVLVLQSCNIYKEVEVLEVRDVALKEFSQDQVEIEVTLVLDNPNWYKIKIVDSDLDLYLNKRDIGNLKLADKVYVPKKTRSVQTIGIYTDYKDLKENFLQNMLTLLFTSKTELQVTGYVKARGLMVGKKVLVDVKQEVDLKEFDF